VHDGLIEAFHRLPYPVRVLAATVNGIRLSRWRYGRDTETLVRKALGREDWEPERWREWQADRLQTQLRRARFSVPWYRDWWERRIRNSGDDWEELSNWPVVTKEILRPNQEKFVRDGARRPWVARTSGSTGTPLSLRVSRSALRSWYGLFEARIRKWNNVSRRDRWAIIGGQRIVAIDRKKPPFWVWNAAMKQLYISAYHVAPWSASAIVEAIRRARATYLWGYASALDALAQEMLEQGIEPPPLQLVFSNAEPLLEIQKERIGSAFRCRVVNTYSADMVIGASECEAGNFHIWPEAGIVEVLGEDDRPAGSGRVGRIISTGLLNDAMPLIRYEVGDRGALAPPSESCGCGRTLPLLLEIEGRLDDVVVTPDGRRIGRLDTVFKEDLPIRRAQIVQESIGRLTVRVLPAHGYSPEVRGRIKQSVLERVGDVKVDIVEVSDLPLGPNGKFRGVISRVSGGDLPEGINYEK